VLTGAARDASTLTRNGAMIAGGTAHVVVVVRSYAYNPTDLGRGTVVATAC